jgi:hypothetical protein
MPDLFITGIALFYAWLFGLAAWHKFTALTYYEAVVRDMLSTVPGFRFISDRTTRFVVLAIATTEACLALALIIPAYYATTLIGSAALLLFYAGILAWQIQLGRDGMDCGCAGPASGVVTNEKLVFRNLIFALPAGLVLFPILQQPLSVLSGTLSITIAAFLIATYSCSEQLIANSQSAIALGLTPPRTMGRAN